MESAPPDAGRKIWAQLGMDKQPVFPAMIAAALILLFLLYIGMAESSGPGTLGMAVLAPLNIYLLPLLVISDIISNMLKTSLDISVFPIIYAIVLPLVLRHIFSRYGRRKTLIAIAGLYIASYAIGLAWLAGGPNVCTSISTFGKFLTGCVYV